MLFTPGRWKKPRYDGLIAVDIFAGIGGVSLGFKHAGIHTPIAIDMDPWCMLTYMTNLGRDPAKPVCYMRKDIRQLKATDILDTLEKMGYEPRVDILHGSPPCQDWSLANMKKGQRDVCSFDVGGRYCMIEYVRIIKELRPRYFTMENVPGLVQGKMRPLFDEFIFRLREAGYSVKWDILDAANYGVPQHRKRVFAIGSIQYEEMPTIHDNLFVTADPPKFLTIPSGDYDGQYLGQIEI